MNIKSWRCGVALLAIAAVTTNQASTASAVAFSALELELIGRYESFAGFDKGGSEIVSYDPTSQNLFVINAAAASIDIVNISNPRTPTLQSTITVPNVGGINSVAVKNGIVAAAVQASVKTDNGSVMFFNTAGSFLGQATVGALPDMVTFSPDGMKVLIANEGEPDFYGTGGTDPVGSISIVDISGGIFADMNPATTNAGFAAYIGQEQTLRNAGVRIYGPGANAAQDLEPEYIAVSADSTKAFVTLQENNAIAIVDIATSTVEAVVPLGFKDHSLPGQGLDLSDRDGPGKDPAFNIINAPVFGMYQPDSIAAYQVNGKTYLVTGNEGDSREYENPNDSLQDYAEEVRIGDIALGDLAPNLQFLKSSDDTSRLTVVDSLGRTLMDGQGDDNLPDWEKLFVLGGRSFSIWEVDGTTITQVFDSGEDLERITEALLPPGAFNSNNDESPSFDNRSDNKGPEPEGVALAVIDGRTLAFIGLERVGGVMVYDVTDPFNASFLTYVNERDFSVVFDEDSFSDPLTASERALLSSIGDLGPEGLFVISAADSPNGRELLIVGNEVSGTTSIFQVNPIPEPATLGLLLPAMGALAIRRRKLSA